MTSVADLNLLRLDGLLRWSVRRLAVARSGGLVRLPQTHQPPNQTAIILCAAVFQTSDFEGNRSIHA